MSDTRDPEHDQQLPVAPVDTAARCAQDIVIEEMERSKAVGLAKYGSAGVFPGNGRDQLRDLADELRDGLVYVTAAIMERDQRRASLHAANRYFIEELAKVLCVEAHNEMPAEDALALFEGGENEAWRFRAAELTYGPLNDAIDGMFFVGLAAGEKS